MDFSVNIPNNYYFLYFIFKLIIQFFKKFLNRKNKNEEVKSYTSSLINLIQLSNPESYLILYLENDHGKSAESGLFNYFSHNFIKYTPYLLLVKYLINSCLKVSNAFSAISFEVKYTCPKIFKV